MTKLRLATIVCFAIAAFFASPASASAPARTGCDLGDSFSNQGFNALDAHDLSGAYVALKYSAEAYGDCADNATGTRRYLYLLLKARNLVFAGKAARASGDVLGEAAPLTTEGMTELRSLSHESDAPKFIRENAVETMRELSR